MSAPNSQLRGGLSEVLFPITPATVETTLAGLQVDFFDSSLGARELLYEDDILLAATERLLERWNVRPGQDERFEDGCVLTLCLCSFQATAAGVELPLTDERTYNGFFDRDKGFDRLSTVNANATVSRIRATDQKFAGAVRDFMKGHTKQLSAPDQAVFRYGSFAMYEFLKHQYEVVDLDQMFDMQYVKPSSGEPETTL